jgi:MFS family permease
MEVEKMSNISKDRRLHTLLLANITSSVGTGITSISIPWMLVNREGGEAVFGYATLFVSIVLFFVSPYIGVLIDRTSRKRFLLSCQFLGFLFMVPIALYGFFFEFYPTWLLVSMQVGWALYYSAQMPALFAFCQEIFDRSQYKTLNGTLETQNQFASMVSGGAASFLLSKVDLAVILMIDAATYLLAFLLFLSIPYRFAKEERGVKKVTVWTNMQEGFRYLKGTPMLLLFFTCSRSFA